MGLHLGLGDDLLGSNVETNLLKDEEKQEDTDQRAAFPVMDAFKEHTLLTADDLKDKVENSYSDQGGIREAVDNALKKLHKKKQQAAAAAAHPAAGGGQYRAVTAKELIDEVVQKEIASHLGSDATQQVHDTVAAGSDETKGKVHEKLEEISNLERRLFSLIDEVKGYLSKKKGDQGDNEHDSNEDSDSDLDKITIDKRSEIPFNIDRFRRNVSLVEDFIRDALKDDFTINTSSYDGSVENNEDAKQGDTRDLLGKKEMQEALLKQAVPGEIEDIPVSSLERDIDENDTLASDHGIGRDALVDSPFSSLDYKKVTGKRSRHHIS